MVLLRRDTFDVVLFATLIFATTGSGTTSAQKPTIIERGDYSELPYTTPVEFCRGVAAVVRARASSGGTTKTATIFGQTRARTIVPLSVIEIVRQDPDHPIGGMVPVSFAKATYDRPDARVRSIGGIDPPRRGTEFLMFLRWDKNFDAFYPVNGATGLYELKANDALKVTTKERVGENVGKMRASALVATLKADPSCARQ